ncbi:MAG: Co2+/Mg2+ efflux protein ApaG [Bacteroidetes bacterium]|nr:Co2+/Mg2+ efflux protein ApaG [Bacteroidota bacterium]
MNPYVATTENITVRVRPVYLDGQSDIMARKFVFAYSVRIENHRAERMQLLRRHWYIRDGTGKVREVEGEGVVGQQPIIPPRGWHDYVSNCILNTFEGTMEGTYLMRRPNGELLEVAIPRFALRAAAN